MKEDFKSIKPIKIRDANIVEPTYPVNKKARLKKGRTLLYDIPSLREYKAGLPAEEAHWIGL